MTKLTRKTILKHDCLHCQFYAPYLCALDRCCLEPEEKAHSHAASRPAEPEKIVRM